MKKINNNTYSTQRKTLTILGVVVTILIAYATVAYAFKLFPFVSQETLNTQNAQKTDSDAKKNFIENEPNTPSPDKEGNSSTGPLTHNEDDVIVTTKQDSSDLFTVLTKLYGYSDGQCSLMISNNGKTYTDTAAVLFQSEYSTCAGFTIPINKLSTGVWNISLSVTSSGKTINKQLSVEVK